MCGIIGYAGKEGACQVLIHGLQNLEYRGYDSCGIAIKGSPLVVHKVQGGVEQLEGMHFPGTVGIAHTRWSTHGIPSQKNAHPHVDCTGKIAIVHNGIVENFLELKEQLKNHTFVSDTDSEVLAHLIEEQYTGDLQAAVQAALKEVEGTYAICVMHQDHEELVVARNGSPMVLGLGNGEVFAASDVAAFIERTKKVMYLQDLEVAVVTPRGIRLYDRRGKERPFQAKTVDWDVSQAQKQGFKHFMLKEIFEQPEVVRESLRIHIPEIKAKHIHLIACGTAWHAALVGKYILEQFASIPVQVDVASEFRYRKPIIEKGDLFIAISQSGETADTLAALRLAKEKGAKTLGIINVVDATIAREADEVIYTRAGPEIGVASTKAFISQLIVLSLLAQKLAGRKVQGMEALPELMQSILDQHDSIRTIARKYSKVYNFLYIGRNANYPIALEGALKLKEISYIHAEGYASGEMKHGPIALVTDAVPTVAIAVKDTVYPKMISNIQEIRARNGSVIAVATEGDEAIKKHCDDVIYIPKTSELLYPMLTVIPLQLLAYYIADMRECDVDKPRNLAKSVTVE